MFINPHLCVTCYPLVADCEHYVISAKSKRTSLIHTSRENRWTLATQEVPACPPSVALCVYFALTFWPKLDANHSLSSSELDHVISWVLTSCCYMMWMLQYGILKLGFGSTDWAQQIVGTKMTKAQYSPLLSWACEVNNSLLITRVTCQNKRPLPDFAPGFG